MRSKSPFIASFRAAADRAKSPGKRFAQAPRTRRRQVNSRQAPSREIPGQEQAASEIPWQELIPRLQVPHPEQIPPSPPAGSGGIFSKTGERSQVPQHPQQQAAKPAVPSPEAAPAAGGMPNVSLPAPSAGVVGGSSPGGATPNSARRTAAGTETSCRRGRGGTARHCRPGLQGCRLLP